MNKNAIRIFFLLGFVTCQTSCGTGRQGDCVKQIKEEIHPGLPLYTAEADLKKCGFKTTIDRAKNTLYADKVVEGNPVSERTQVLITLDSDSKVNTVSVTTGLIAP